MPTCRERDSKIIAVRCKPLQLSWSAGDEGERKMLTLVGDDGKKSVPEESVGE
jgi:hypothetical protein